jgi:glucosamine 6-phosphate synthetase-like amidotransferase/phosphosugar isomerase protein
MPALRDGPPYFMTEMVAAEPALAERLARRLGDDPAVRAVGSAMKRAIADRQPITITGCGTSEHAAMGIAALLREAIGAGNAYLVRAVQALDLWRDPQAAGVVVAVSHEGGTSATNQAMASSRAAGATAAIVTGSAGSPGAGMAELVIATGEMDQSWCHTVGYLSPLIVGAALAAELRNAQLDATAIRGLLEAASEQSASAGELARSLASVRRLVTAGTGADYVTARELALKIEEGSGLPAVAIQLETVRHGHFAAMDEGDGMIVVLTDAEPAGEIVRQRAVRVLRAGVALATTSAALLGARIGPQIPHDVTAAGRLVVPEANQLTPVTESLLGAAIPLQLLAEQLAIARGRNPDLIGRDEPRHAAGAAV